MLLAALLALLAYLAASLNFPLALHGLGWMADPRGGLSGNPGVSNVYRTAGPGWAALVLLLDVARAAGLALMALLLLPSMWVPAVAVGLIAGNRWPLAHRFRGGKGVANYLGFTAAVAPWASLAAAGAWVAVYLLSRLTFIASSIMVLILGIGTVVRCGPSAPVLVGTGLIIGAILAAHRANLAAWRFRRRDRSEGGSRGAGS